MSRGFDRLADAIEGRVRNAAVDAVNRRLPEQMRVNPEDLHGGDDSEGDDDGDGDDDDDESDGGDDSDDGSASYLHFSFPDRDRNLALAAAAWRIMGESSDVVGYYEPTGEAFFGDVDDLGDLAKSRNHKPSHWVVYDDPDEIMDLDYDSHAIRKMLAHLERHEDAFEAARKQYEAFHWGDKAKGVSITEVPGISCPLTHLGVARRIEYGAAKAGKWEEYYHEHGEESGHFPMIYAGPIPEGQKWPVWYLVFGGKMHIADDGIRD